MKARRRRRQRKAPPVSTAADACPVPPLAYRWPRNPHAPHRIERG